MVPPTLLTVFILVYMQFCLNNAGYLTKEFPHLAVARYLLGPCANVWIDIVSHVRMENLFAHVVYQLLCGVGVAGDVVDEKIRARFAILQES